MKKLMIACAVSVLLLLACFLAWGQTDKEDMPPGVPSGSWMPMSKDSGIVITGRNYVNGKPAIHGTLMVRMMGMWQEVYLDPGPAALTHTK